MAHRTTKQRCKNRVASWIPSELSAEDRATLLAEMKDDCINAIEAAIQIGTAEDETPAKNDDEDEESAEESPEEG